MGYGRDEKEEIEGWEEMAVGARVACWGGLSGDYQRREQMRGLNSLGGDIGPMHTGLACPKRGEGSE